MTDTMKEAFADSHSTSTKTRLNAVLSIAKFAPREDAARRLGEMLRDDNITVRVDAAEALLVQFGKAGLEIVFDEMVRSASEAESDYIAYKVLEIDASKFEDTLLDDARTLAGERRSKDLAALVDRLVAYRDRLQGAQQDPNSGAD